MQAVEKARQRLGETRVWVDTREEVTPGFKFHEWEMRGVPVRIEIGPRDVAQSTAALGRRDLPGKEGKTVVPMERLGDAVRGLLDEVQASLFERARRFRIEHTHSPRDYDEFRQVVQGGWAEAWWCGEQDCEAQIKDDTKATTRCIPFDQPGGSGRCIRCERPATERAIFARAY
jgi:prolyl-tRNA synthetase